MGSALPIPSVSACPPGTSCPAPTLRYGRYLPASLLGALLSPPQTRSLFPPPAAVTYLPPPGHARIPCVERQANETRPPTSGILQRFALQNDRKGAVILSVSGGAWLQNGRLMKHAFLRTGFFVASLLRMTFLWKCCVPHRRLFPADERPFSRTEEGSFYSVFYCSAGGAGGCCAGWARR